MPVSKKNTVTATSIAPGVTALNDGTVEALKAAVFGTSSIKPLLDGTANNLEQYVAGNFIADVVFYTNNASGTAGTVNVGTDANWSLASDADAFITASDANAPGSERTTIAGNAGQSGVSATGNANIVITSSADLSASSWQGGVIIFYY